MLQADRRRETYELIERTGSASVTDLSRELDVSVQTVRRDLEVLEEEGLIERVHGGAVVLGNGGATGGAGAAAVEGAAVERGPAHADEKRRIGAAAAALVAPGSTIFLSGGTTTEQVIAHLPEHARITVVTNAVNVAYALGRRPGIETIVLGGYLRHSEGTLLGPMAEEAIRGFRLDQALYGCYGLDPEGGLSGASLAEAAMDRVVLDAVDRLTVLADSSKFAQRGPVRLADVTRITTLVTDRDAPGESVRRLKQHGVEVTVA
jgi:DeoR family transcriptional regulator, aga operon transcriptional repressor